MKKKTKNKGKLFGKPRKDVVKEPGSYGSSTEKEDDKNIKKGGKIAKKAGLAKAFRTMRAEKKAKRGGKEKKSSKRSRKG